MLLKDKQWHNWCWKFNMLHMMFQNGNIFPPRQQPLSEAVKKTKTNKPHILETCFHNTNTLPERHLNSRECVFTYFAALDQITEGKQERKQLEKLKQIYHQNDHNNKIFSKHGWCSSSSHYLRLTFDSFTRSFSLASTTICARISHRNQFFHTLVLRTLINDAGD